jgi:hypothetical protein
MSWWPLRVEPRYIDKDWIRAEGFANFQAPGDPFATQAVGNTDLALQLYASSGDRWVGMVIS